MFGDFFRCPVCQGVHLDVAMRITDDQKRPVAVLVLRTDADEELYPLIQAWPLPSASAETLLLRREGQGVLFVNVLRHGSNPALTLRIALSCTNVPAIQAALGRVGFFEGQDYRGVDVLSYVQPVPGSPWFMVSKIDRREIFAEVRFRGMVIVMLVALGTIIAVLLTVAVGSAQRRQLYEGLYRAERAQREIREEIRATLYGIGDGVIATDAAGCVTRMNPVAEQLTSWRESEALGRPLNDVFRTINETTRVQASNPVDRVLRDDITVDLGHHMILIARDGTEHPVADSAAPIRNEQGATTGVVLVFRDQSAERAAERQLTASEMRYRRLFECAQDGILMLEADTGVIAAINPLLAGLLGCTDGEVIGRHVWEVDGLRVLSETREAFLAWRAQARASYQSLILTHKDGRRTETEVVSSDYEVAGTRMIQCTIRDVTDRRRLEAERTRLAAQNQQLQKAESLGRMAGAIAHNFNNQLHAVLAHIELAMAGAPSDSAVGENLTQAMLAAHRAAEVSSLMLIYLGKTGGQRAPLDLAEVCRHRLPMLRASLPRNALLETRLPTPGPVVQANADQIKRVLSNLVSNAGESLGESGGTVHVSVSTCGRGDIPTSYRFPLAWEPQDSHYACLAVRDTGSGMDERDIERIFDPFYTTKFTGRGLGLSVVLGLVRAHEGCIAVESRAGGGSIFRVFLPLTMDAVPLLPKPAVPAPAPVGGGTVLLVDDDPVVRGVTRAMLAKLGFAVVEAPDGSEAVELFRQHKHTIRCVLSDLTMPRLDGWATLAALRKIDPAVPVILASGYDQAQVMGEAHTELPQAFLGKPYQVPELRDALRKCGLGCAR